MPLCVDKREMPGRWDGSQMLSMGGKVVVITGANAGIGLATAHGMAAKGAYVVLGCRNEARGRQAEREICEATGSTTVEFMQLDVGNLASIRAFVEAFKAKFDHLDVLVNNAGVMHPPEPTTVDGFEAHFGVNHLGHFYLTYQLFDSLTRAQEEARVVSLSSTNHRYVSEKTDFSSLGESVVAGKLMNEYSTSKLCNLLFIYELDRRLKRSGSTKVKAVACHPGITLTNITPSAIKAHLMPNWVQRGLNGIISILPIFQTPEIGALSTLYAASEPHVQSGDFIGPDGWHAFWGYPTKDESSPLSHSVEAAEQLWKRSEELLGVTFSP